MGEAENVDHLGFRCLIDASNLRCLHTSTEEDADLEKTSLGPHEEVTRFAREHDRTVGRVDALIAELDRRFTETFPGVTKIV